MSIELDTKRLKLRQWRASDIDAYAQICADLEVMKYLTGKAFSRMESWRHMAFLTGHWQLLGFGHWAVEEKATGCLIGRVGFLQPDGWPGFEIGWTLGRNYWGKGYATEAARKVMDYGFNTLNKTHIISIIHPDNHNSKQVAARLGESYERRENLNGFNLEIWGISKEV
ncbi:MAG: RimJ/RimL family protein N-acetyltransferase [Phenylobacterium sp.]|jgi:RimJ/RimL family protein N-acetyltransferase